MRRKPHLCVLVFSLSELFSLSFYLARITWTLMRRRCLQHRSACQQNNLLISFFATPSLEGFNMAERRSVPYGPLKFLGDLLMITLTSGLWIVWIIIREIRYR